MNERSEQNLNSIRRRKCVCFLIVFAAVLMLVFGMPGFAGNDCFAYNGSGGNAAGITDTRADRVLSVRSLITPCWSNKERGSSNTSGYLYDGDSYILGLPLCDQHRLVVTKYEVIDGSFFSLGILTGDEMVITSSDESVLEIGSDGKFVLHKTGNPVLTVFVPGDEQFKDCTITLPVAIYRESGFNEEQLVWCVWDYDHGHNISVTPADGPQQIQISLKPGAHVTFRSKDPQIAEVDENGFVTPVSDGYTVIYTDCDEGDHGQFLARTVENYITVTGSDDRTAQTIEGSLVPVTIESGKTYKLDLTAKTQLSYTTSNAVIATVSEDGTITGQNTGSAVITINAKGDETYRPAKAEVRVTVVANTSGGSGNGSGNESGSGSGLEQIAGGTNAVSAAKAQQAAHLAAQKKQQALALARSLKAPMLKCTRKKAKNKLSWNKVAGATGYEIYIKYPKSKKYVKALTKGANIKSVTHKGLSRKKKYSYKVRAFAVIDGTYYYGPFSKAKKVKVK